MQHLLRTHRAGGLPKMTAHNKDLVDTSRRNFAGSLLTAALAMPMASMASKATQIEKPQTVDVCPVTIISGMGYQGFEYKPDELVPAEHIPPMDIEGGGSLTLDSHNELTHSGKGPYVYEEADDVSPQNLYGDIVKVNIITELGVDPWIKFQHYDITPGAHAQLLLWYQKISATPQDDNDTTFPPATYGSDPDILIVGGKGRADKFSMVVKNKKFSTDKSHKKNRPYRCQHTKGGALGRHFRIGKWRLLGGTALIAEASGDENYKIYLTFGDLQ